VRRPPKGFPLFHIYDLEQQYRTIAALQGTDVPVPGLVGLELDASVLGEPFYVMHKVEGRPPPDLPPFTAVGWVLESTPTEQAELYARAVEVLARVHHLDLDAVDVGFLRSGETASGLGDQLLATERWFRWAAEGEPQPVLDATWRWLQQHRPRDPAPEGLNWGDARLGNLLFDGLHPVAVLDWEMAAIGPAEVDLGWWLFLNRHHTEGMGIPPLPGFPDDATTVAMYEEALGRSTRDVLWYDVLGGFRFGIIVLRAARGMRRDGSLPADSDFGRVNGATTLLARMLDLPAPA
jgi:aminoglycoside phosphotransferase (APT) family kinase protein